MRPVPTLAETADEMEQAARRLHEEGQFQAASELWKAAADLRAAIRAIPDGLTVKQRDRILKGVEHSTETRAELSKRFTRGKSPNRDAARAAGYPSLRALAEALKKETGKCSASFLSQVAAGDRPMPADKAKAFKKLTGKDWQ